MRTASWRPRRHRVATAASSAPRCTLVSPRTTAGAQLEEGVDADLGARWNAIVAASVALTDTPSAFGEEEIARLRAAGLDDLEVADVIHGAAFFNWANRLMLSIGRPVAPA